MRNSPFGDDVLSEFWTTVIGATLPLLTLGLLGDRCLLYVSATVGGIALVMLVAGWVFGVGSEVGSVVMTLSKGLSLPYVIALCSWIMEGRGLNALAGLWISLALAVLMLVGNVITLTRRK